MSDLKNKRTGASVTEFLATIEDPQRKKDWKAIGKTM